MKTNKNQYLIYLCTAKQRIPCTKEQFDDYYRYIKESDLKNKPAWLMG